MRLSAPTGPRSSIGSPMTLMMRPSVLGPTGTEICAPVLVTALAAGQAVGRVHGDGAHGVFAEVLGDFEHQRLPLLSVSSAERIAGSSPVERHVDDGADDLADGAGGGLVETGAVAILVPCFDIPLSPAFGVA